MILLSTVIDKTTSFTSIGTPASRSAKWSARIVKDTTSAIPSCLGMGFRDPDFFRRDEIFESIDEELLRDSKDGFVKLGSFPVKGQGAIGIKFVVEEDTEEVQFRFDPEDGYDTDTYDPHPILQTISRKNGWVVKDLVTNEILVTTPPRDRELPILDPGRNETFWMSFDKENIILRGGTGYMITALQSFKKKFTASCRDSYMKHYGILQRYSMYKPSSVMKGGDYVRYPSKYPVYKDLPPIVKAHEDITLEDLDTGSAISIKELSPECQRLYENVAGANIKIDSVDFPDFAQAIDYSINFGFCKKKLESKAQTEFTSGEKDYLHHYLVKKKPAQVQLV